MADRNARGLNLDEVLDRILDGSSDEESIDEEDSDAEVEQILREAHIVQELEMEQCRGDKENTEDSAWGWERNDNPPLLMPFDSHVGLTCDLPENPTPLDFFYLLFDSEFWQKIVTETNLYAEQNIAKETLKPNSRFHDWKDLTLDEVKVFFALIISMGITRKNDLGDYWSTDEILNTPLFSKYMSKNRFILILSMLHLADNSVAPNRGDVGYDRLYKVRPFLSMMKTNFTKYDPERDLSFDEGTCPFKGRVHFRVYNPNKPNKFGIKLYQVCEASSGYCLGFDVYHGETDCVAAVDTLETEVDNGQGPTDHYGDLTMTSKIVLGLLSMTGLLSKGHHVYMDNYYTSPELYEELDLLDTYACGTLRSNRKNVPKIFSSLRKMKQGEGVFRRKKNLLAVKFHDKRDIHMLTTIHEAKLVVTDKVDRRTQEPILKPKCIVEYIQKMGGVDLNDQIVQYYEVLRKCVKWWKKLFLHLFNLLLVNAYILYRKYGGNIKKKSHLDFRVKLVKSLLESAPNAPRPSRGGRKSENIDRLTGRHFIQNIKPKEGAKRKNPMRDCIVCNLPVNERQGNKRKQTTFECRQCSVPLCLPNCFERYHTLKKYKFTPQESSDSD
ncbi:piggyBac transposable element-derived protein 4-like [Saccostrea cucullata]|uniref:piggyBac transposable element-derived protein 4-like n=1 Tax=Saccostrea cuccullata TaxID=36930 RepID=UPI002ED6BF5A